MKRSKGILSKSSLGVALIVVIALGLVMPVQATPIKAWATAIRDEFGIRITELHLLDLSLGQSLGFAVVSGLTQGGQCSYS